MRKLCAFILLATLLSSCDDGDVLVTSFNFEDATLQFCEGASSLVFFKINDASNESLSLQLDVEDGAFTQSSTLQFQLNETTNFINYRTFDIAPTASYFCNSIPPTSPTVLQDYIGTDGTANLIIVAVLNDNDSVEEDTESDLDTDMDGLLNYYDFDDDGDNVPTAIEIGADLDNPMDTDGDGIPDYLDEDDDGDGVLTRNEATEDDIDPQNNITDPNVGADYLNPAIAVETTIEIYIEHQYDYASSAELFVNNAVFTNGEEELTQESLDLGTISNIATGTLILTPIFPGL
ncbi:hypothetical protein [Rasiella sp. SM2506]|uniref:hypothetical protein n=1 Tax=Rasiella sp. SM2506 TaxID=3423914 RepID=UPI003D78F955